MKRLLIAVALLCSALVYGADDDDSKAILELGGAASVNVPGGGSSGGADFAVEFTPIENWLEIEAGTSPVFSAHASEWDTDLLFKKPWTLSKRAELMVGIGPAWVLTRENHASVNSLAGEAALDFMYWPGGKHHFGWFVEPGYQWGREHSIGVSAGLLIAIR